MAKITSATPSKNVATKVSKPIGEVKIRRPENCFMLFKKAFARENGKIRSQQDLCKAASQAWHAMDAEEQAPWRELQERVKAEHARKYPGYVYKPKPKAPKHAVKRDAAFTLPPAPHLTPARLVPNSGHGASTMPQLIGMSVPNAQPQIAIGLDGNCAGYNTYSDYFVEPHFHQQAAFEPSPPQVRETLGAPGQYRGLNGGLDWNGVSYPAMPMEPSLFNSFYGPSAPGMDLVDSTARFDFGGQFMGTSSAGTSDDQSVFTYL